MEAPITDFESIFDNYRPKPERMRPPSYRWTTFDLVRKAAEIGGFRPDEITGKRRLRQLVSARHSLVYAVHVARPHLTYDELGKMVNRDHSTAIHAVRNVENLLPTDPFIQFYTSALVGMAAERRLNLIGGTTIAHGVPSRINAELDAEQARVAA